MITNNLDNINDIKYITDLNSKGLEYFLKNYDSTNSSIELYLLFYLASNVFKKEKKETIYLENLLLVKNNFIINLLNINNKEILVIQEKIINNILQVVLNLSLEKKIKIYNDLFDISKVLNYIYSKTNFLKNNLSNDYTNNLIGDIIDKLNFDINFKLNISIILEYFDNINNKYKIEILEWFKNIILRNLEYEKSINIINNNNNLCNLKFMNKIFITLLSMYIKNREFISFEEIDYNIFLYKDQKIINLFSEELNNLTKIFIYNIKILELSILPSIEKKKLLEKEIIKIDDSITILQDNNNRDLDMFSKLITVVSLEKKKKNKQNEILNINLHNKFYVESVIYLLNDISKILLNSESNLNSPISKIIINNVATIIEYYKEDIYNTQEENILKLLELVVYTIIEKIKNINIHIKIFLLKFLSKKNNIIKKILTNYSKKNFNLSDFIIGLINLYLSISRIEDKNILEISRNEINKIMINIIDDNNFIKNTELCNKFIFNIISDTNDYYQEILKFINKIYNNQECINDILIDELNILKKNLIYFRINIKLLIKIIKYNNNFLIDDNIIIEKFIKSNNFWIINMINNRDNLKHIIYKYNYLKDINLNKFYKYFINIFLEFSNNKKFIKILINEKMYYDNCIFYNLMTYTDDSYKKKILQEMLDKIIFEKKNSIKENNIDIPLEFCDPILYTPIKNPVILPESLIYMDYDIIKNHLLTNEIDPFNRTKLTINELEEFNTKEENIEKINKFKEEFEVWKKNNNY